VTGSAKRGFIADPSNTYLETHNLTCEFGTALKLALNILLIWQNYLVYYKSVSLKPEEI